MKPLKALMVVAVAGTAAMPGTAFALDDPFNLFLRSILHGSSVYKQPDRGHRYIYRNDDDDDGRRGRGFSRKHDDDDDGRRGYRGFSRDDDDDDGRRGWRRHDDDD
ncbi:hypothetical protein [Paracoccus siganidrum]|uniref:hypothetical protein n=1 Tax=Paracoccus siganidrum TaxID=1276757 RepID=UPI00197E1FAC|nr:hypothetical protein [Paracoccus siganidrum]